MVKSLEPKRNDCAGTGRPALGLTSPGRGICPVCEYDLPVYDSSRHGPGLLDRHQARKKSWRAEPAEGGPRAADIGP